MSQLHTARPRPQAPSAAAVALDFGLRVRLDGHGDQRTLFSGAENLSLQELCTELGLMISELRVRSFSLRHELEQVTEALLVNVRCGSAAAAEPRSISRSFCLGLKRAWPMRALPSAAATPLRASRNFAREAADGWCSRISPRLTAG
jgi:hypothetical protein